MLRGRGDCCAAQPRRRTWSASACRFLTSSPNTSSSPSSHNSPNSPSSHTSPSLKQHPQTSQQRYISTTFTQNQDKDPKPHHHPTTYQPPQNDNGCPQEKEEKRLGRIEAAFRKFDLDGDGYLRCKLKFKFTLST